MPGFDAHRSYAIGKRECLLPIAVSMPGFEARRSYDRSYVVGKRECLLHIAVMIAVTQLGREGVCCLLQSVCLVLTHIAVTQLGIESVYCISQLRNWE
jgi:hypothetical protein